MYNQFEMTIGLETHIQLKTKNKLFCECKNEFTLEPDIHCCPVCRGDIKDDLKINIEAVEKAITAGIVTNCHINKISSWDRKNYSYPDLPKGYQITQYDIPLCENGYIDIGTKKIRIERIHMEEDAGKLIYNKDGEVICDHNRCGVPLIEIVTKPDIKSACEASEYLKKLRLNMLYLNVSDCKMEEGSLRCDVNISVKRKEDINSGVKCEIKNLNSFSFIEKAIDYEFKRQVDLILKGEKIIQETRKFDSGKGITVSMRTKENSSDYGYETEPFLDKLFVSSDLIENIKKTIPVLPEKRMKKYVDEYGLSESDAKLIVSIKNISDFFEDCIDNVNCRLTLSNIIVNEVLKLSKNGEIKVSKNQLTELSNLLSDNLISNQSAKKILEKIWDTQFLPKDLCDKMDLWQISSEEILYPIVKDTIDCNVKIIEDYKKGKTNAIKTIIGIVMKKTSGKANGNVVNKIISDILNTL